MKKGKIINIILFFCVIALIIVPKVKAFQNSLTVSESGSILTFNGTDVEVITEVTSDREYPSFHIKNSNLGNIICVSGFDVTLPTSGTTYTLSEWAGNQRYGVAYIINLIKSTNGTSNQKYYWQEVLVNYYLGNIKNGDKYTGTLTFTNLLNSNSTIKILNTNKNAHTIVEDAKNYANSNPSSNPSITANNVETLNLIFTKNADGYYYSQKVIVNSSENYNFGTISNSKFTYTKSGNEFIFKIKASDIALDRTESFSHVVQVSKSYHVASKYVTDATDGLGNVFQALSLTGIETKTLTDKITINGSVTVKSNSFEVSKIDANNKLIAGAKFMLQTEEQKKTNVEGTTKISTTTSNIKFDGLAVGTYYLKEIESPEGYVKSDVEYKITIKDNGEILVNDVKNTDKVIEVTNVIIKLSIDKLNEKDKFLSGATLKLSNKEKQDISCKILEKDGTERLVNNCTWETTEERVTVVGITPGTYYLTETKSPEKYSRLSSPIKIIVEDDGEILVNGKPSNDGVIKVKNEPTKVIISKVNATNGEELPGATLRVLDKDKKEFACTIIIDKKEKSLDKCSWVSTEKPVTIVGLDFGKYYLEETISPEGFVKQTEMIEFEIKEDETTSDVIMKNELEVKVPDTLSGRSTLLIAISMFDIALGIGIMTYVKKNKTEE